MVSSSKPHLCTSHPNIPDGQITAQNKVVQQGPAGRQRCWHLCFVKGKLSHREDRVFRRHGRAGLWPPGLGSNSCKENKDFLPSLWHFSESFFSMLHVCSGEQGHSPSHTKNSLPFRNTFFQFNFKFIRSMLLPQMLLWYLKWKHLWRVPWDSCPFSPRNSSA